LLQGPAAEQVFSCTMVRQKTWAAAQVRTRGEDLRRTLDQVILLLQHHAERVQWCACPRPVVWPQPSVAQSGVLECTHAHQKRLGRR